MCHWPIGQKTAQIECDQKSEIKILPNFKKKWPLQLLGQKNAKISTYLHL